MAVSIFRRGLSPTCQIFTILRAVNDPRPWWRVEDVEIVARGDDIERIGAVEPEYAQGVEIRGVASIDLFGEDC
jgi:hypothetical protein